MIKNQNMTSPNNNMQQTGITKPLKQYAPPTDIVKTDEALFLYMDMPGVDKDDVQVKLEKNILEVTGSVDSERYSQWKSLYSEYKVGNFLKRFELSSEIDQEKIEAKVNAGVVTVVLPKIPEKQAKIITVN